MVKGRYLLFGFMDAKSPRKIPPPKIPSTTIHKITQDFVITPHPFFVDVINEKHLTIKTYC